MSSSDCNDKVRAHDVLFYITNRVDDGVQDFEAFKLLKLSAAQTG